MNRPPYSVIDKGDHFEVWHEDGKQALRSPELGFTPSHFKDRAAAQAICDAMNQHLVGRS